MIGVAVAALSALVASPASPVTIGSAAMNCAREVSLMSHSEPKIVRIFCAARRPSIAIALDRTSRRRFAASRRDTLQGLSDGEGVFEIIGERSESRRR